MKRKLPIGRIVLVLFITLVVVAAAAFLAPEIDAEPLRGPVQRALARTIGRDVEFRAMEYQVYPIPGLKVLDLVIPEDPQFGREPVAYVTEMQVGLSWRSVFTRSLQVSSVKLVDSSLNLALSNEHGWNVVRLLRQMVGGVDAARRMPTVELSACRVNFRTGLRKSAYYLNTVDLELESSGGAGGFTWNFEASPARTDRAEQGFGRFTGQGKWTANETGDGALDVEIELEPSALSEVTQFLAGRDLGLNGRLASRVRLGGSPQSLQLTGTIELAGIDRPALFGLRQAEFGLPVAGVLDVQAQTLHIQTKEPKPEQAAPVSAEFHASSLFSQPVWQLQAGFDGLPAPTFLDLTRKLGTRVPAGLILDGKLSGTVKLSAVSGLDGELALNQATVRLGEAGPLEIPGALVRLSGTTVSLAKTTVRTAEGNEAEIEGSWSADTEAFDFAAETQKITMGELLAAKASLPGVPALPLLSECRDGDLSGTLQFHRGPQVDEPDPGEWRGEVQVSALECPVIGASQPILLQRGSLSFRKANWTARRVQGTWAGLPFAGEAVSQPEAKRPFRFSIQMPRARWSQLEALMEPALLRRRSLLERTLRLRRSTAPSWLDGRHAEGKFEFKTLEVGETPWNNVKGQLYWDGGQFEVPQISASFQEAKLDGRLRLALSSEAPEYQLLGNLSGWPWMGGAIDADFDLRARGFGADLESGAHVSGNFLALRPAFPEGPLRRLEGSYDYDAARRGARLKLTAVGAESAAGENWTGQGGSAEGLVSLELTSARGARKLSWPLQSLRPVAGEAPRAR